MAVIDKFKSMEAIQQTDDERGLFAICRLLQIEEEEMPEWQKHELDKRNERIDTGAKALYDWDAIKDKISNLD